MSVEFRQRTPAEYAHIVWRRKWLIILPTIAFTLAVAWVIWRLPNIYESTTLLTVRPSTIPNAIVPQLSDDDLTIRINNISQEVVSRSTLEPLIERYSLYRPEVARGEPMEVLVARMRTRDIRVRINTSRNDITNGFNISFRGPDPDTTKAVTAELAGKYVNAETKAKTEEAAQTKQFFEQQLKQVKDELDTVDQQRLQYMQQNVQNLPSSAGALIGQLTGLRESQKSLITEMGRLRDQRAAVNSQLGDLAKQREQEIDDIAAQVGDPKATLAYAELRNRRAQLEAERQQLLTEYKPKHPDVLSKQAQIESVKNDMEEMVNDGKTRVEEKRKLLEGRIDPRLNRMRDNLRIIDGELMRQQKDLGTTQLQIVDIERRINSVPGAEVGLERLNRDYQTKKATYDELLSKEQKVSLASDVATNQQGESIRVVDPANYPERPVAPNRPLLMGFGFALGLAIGLAFAAAFEVPRLLTIQTTEDAEHYTHLPVLVSVPELLTVKEERRRRLRRAALASAGVAATIVSVPALALVLKVSRFLELFAK